MAKRQLKPRTRNHNTFTEAQFWSFIRSALRMKSRWWKPITEIKKQSRRLCKNCTGRQKYEYKCNECKKWFKDKEVEVDHLVEAGSLTCADDLAGFVERLFCEIDGLQVLCKKCHNKKTYKK